MLEETITRAWQNLIGRWGGPMSFRLVLQPAVAIVFAVLAGLRDARNGQPPFLWTLLTSAGRRRELLRQGWKDVGMVFIVALILDVLYQVIMHSSIYPLELLITATVLALAPYALIRGLVTRIARRRFAAIRVDGEPEATNILNENHRPDEKQN